MTRPALLLWLLFAGSSAIAGDLAGTVVGVIDGDTIDVLVEGRAVRVRLAEIDAPERRQAFGSKAKRELSALIFRREATVTDEGRDRYGRVVGTVRVDGRNINETMVWMGLAWAYPRYVVHQSYYAAQDAAKAAKRGLWADASPTPPWLFRHAPSVRQERLGVFDGDGHDPNRDSGKQ